jgi:hypothetical protein
LEALKAEFLAMSADTSDPHQRGLNFETFLYKAFALFDMEPRLKYSLKYEQIDGAMSFDTNDYIIEAKWWKEQLQPPDTADHRPGPAVPALPTAAHAAAALQTPAPRAPDHRASRAACESAAALLAFYTSSRG